MCESLSIRVLSDRYFPFLLDVRMRPVIKSLILKVACCAQDTRHLYLDINRLPALRARLDSGFSIGGLSATSSVPALLEFEMPLLTPKLSSMGCPSSSSFLLSAASF